MLGFWKKARAMSTKRTRKQEIQCSDHVSRISRSRTRKHEFAIPKRHNENLVGNFNTMCWFAEWYKIMIYSCGTFVKSSETGPEKLFIWVDDVWTLISWWMHERMNDSTNPSIRTEKCRRPQPTLYLSWHVSVAIMYQIGRYLNSVIGRGVLRAWHYGR